MPAATSTKSIAWFLRHVHGQLGNQEHPLGSNHTEYGKQFGWDGVSWCVEFGWDMYDDAGVVLPVKTASCVVMFDASVKAGLHYTSDHCVPGDAVIRTWQHLPRHAPGFDPQQTHFQIVTAIKHVGGVKYLGLTGGNQGAGYVGPAVEWVRAGDSSIVGGLAFHRLFGARQGTKPRHDKRRDGPKMPAPKSHKHPKHDEPKHPGPKPSGRQMPYGWLRRGVTRHMTADLAAGDELTGKAATDLPGLAKAIDDAPKATP